MPNLGKIEGYIVDALPGAANRNPHDVYYVKNAALDEHCRCFVVGATTDVVREVGFNEVATTSLAAYDADVKPGSFITQKYHEDHSDLKLIRSYGHQLVKNFNGLVGDNTNFSGFEATTDYAAEIAVAKTYKRTGYIATLCDEIVPITTRRVYDLSFDFWLYGSDWVTDRRFYVFTDFYDDDGHKISSDCIPYGDASVGYLTQAANAGDTQLHVTPMALRSKGAADVRTGVRPGNYVTASGIKFNKGLGYSRWTLNDKNNTYADNSNVNWAATTADTASNPDANHVTVLHLNAPLAATSPLIGQTIDPASPDRAYVFDWIYGGTYLYTNTRATVNGIPTTETSSYLRGYEFAGVTLENLGQWRNIKWRLDSREKLAWEVGLAPAGTVGIKVGALLNYGAPNNKGTYITNVMIEERPVAVIPIVPGTIAAVTTSAIAGASWTINYTTGPDANYEYRILQDGAEVKPWGTAGLAETFTRTTAAGTYAVVIENRRKGAATVVTHSESIVVAAVTVTISGNPDISMSSGEGYTVNGWMSSSDNSAMEYRVLQGGVTVVDWKPLASNSSLAATVTSGPGSFLVRVEVRNPAAASVVRDFTPKIFDSTPADETILHETGGVHVIEARSEGGGVYLTAWADTATMIEQSTFQYGNWTAYFEMVAATNAQNGGGQRRTVIDAGNTQYRLRCGADVLTLPNTY